jgi:hypothetical protein
VIPEIDIWRVANLMLTRYGDEAVAESAKRADELAADADLGSFRGRGGIGPDAVRPTDLAQAPGAFPPESKPKPVKAVPDRRHRAMLLPVSGGRKKTDANVEGAPASTAPERGG